jgi:hypothetical protein
MSDGESLPNFDDVSYFGLSDTGNDFTGSSTLQDTTWGSPIQLDNTYGGSTASVIDAIDVPEIDSTSTQNSIVAQSLSGVSSPPFGSAAQSTPTPNVSTFSDSTAAGLSALSKFGSSFSSLFSGPPVTHQGSAPVVYTSAGGALPPGAASNTTMLITLVVIGALILLILRED